MTDNTNLDGQKLKAGVDQFAGVGLRQRKNGLEENLNMKRQLVDMSMYFIAPMPLLLFQMMFRSSSLQVRSLGSQVLAEEGT